MSTYRVRSPHVPRGAAQHALAALLFAALMTAPVVAAAQRVVITLADGRKMRVVSSANFGASDADLAVAKILAGSGIQPNFRLVAVDDRSVANAEAQNDDEGRRLILFNTSFLEKAATEGTGKWPAIGILAHEVGHHVNGDVMGARLPTRDESYQRELAADEFAGVQLARMGATLPQALSMFAGLPDVDTGTHPRRSTREGYLLRGWCSNGAGRQSAAFAPAPGARSCGANGTVAQTAAHPPASVPAGAAGSAGPFMPGVPLVLDYDFSIAPSGGARLPETEGEWYKKGYAFGGYAIIDKDYNDDWQAQAVGRALTNPVVIELSAVLKDGDRKSATWGLGFGADNGGQSYYAAIINSGGELRVVRHIGDTTRELLPASRREAIRTGRGAQNTIAVRVSGASVQVFINGVDAGTVRLESAPVGRAVVVSLGHEDGDDDMSVVFLSLRAADR